MARVRPQGRGEGRKGSRTKSTVEYGGLCAMALVRWENTVGASGALCRVPRVRPEGIRGGEEADLAECTLGRGEGRKWAGGLG